ncbi:MAG: adenylate/guanylate cyclase domain-containing protein [Spirochaetales bacterium]|nr:adenylate/guanylate cyclase domain-containing protein [Spirochaetales bacterium]
MGEGKERSIHKWLDPKVFSFFLGCIVFLVIYLLSSATDVFNRLETDVIDLHFQLKFRNTREIIETGVIEETQNLKVSRDIVIIGIDTPTLDTFGRWPFSRDIHANLIKSFSRIKNQNERESALFLDIFFSEPDSDPERDALLVGAMEESGSVFLETILDINPPNYTLKDGNERLDTLQLRGGRITQVGGDISQLVTYYSAESPLIPYGNAVEGYGHANFGSDWDKIYRKQQMIARHSRSLDSVRLDQLKSGEELPFGERLAWQTREGEWIDVELPLSDAALEQLKREMENRAPSRSEDSDGDGTPDNRFYELKHYKDTIVPAITLSLAADYFHTELEELEIVLGKYILFPHPQVLNTSTGELEDYRIMTSYPVVDEQGNVVKEARYRDIREIRIPIDEHGQMLINFMGARSNPGRSGYQTFPVRSYSAYARRVPGDDPERWPRTKAVGNKILMVGGFFQGTDEKTTPFGLMYGVEVHANALNTILMDNFLVPVAHWINTAVLLGMILIISLYSSRINTLLSFVVTLFVAGFYFYLANIFFFENRNILLNFATPMIGGLVSYILIIVYRVVAGESDKRRIKDMFGKYVSPKVVEQMMTNPPELGGVDMDITVFFSDIRSFTTLSESMSPQELVHLLNDYLTIMTDCLIDFNGTLDKYIGDAIMGFWGAPLPQDNHAVLACKSALRQLELLEMLNKKAEPNRQIHIGIGMNSGVGTVGNMGSQGRMNFTVMGDNVNLASRLEGITKVYRTHIVISQSTKEAISVDEKFITRELDDIRVKGKLKPVRIYELVGYDGDLSVKTDDEIQKDKKRAQ